MFDEMGYSAGPRTNCAAIGPASSTWEIRGQKLTLPRAHQLLPTKEVIEVDKNNLWVPIFWWGRVSLYIALLGFLPLYYLQSRSGQHTPSTPKIYICENFSYSISTLHILFLSLITPFSLLSSECFLLQMLGPVIQVTPHMKCRI